ncbi:isoleucine--tRNA ligase [Devosia neptuniae]|jgi:isoleucyl-tRNA synthetase|uniref:isoleucine--tRNA ligase n=1 Tax=Devosia TaxID=46913 RepID=UPI0022B0682D|nr:isoleucine--tRNA ligase [Devosia neptuniae]MCZ4344575.1 isoleucine--tRNA ligase [Devosia neptuniae]|tara:strand:+ start:7921 stop:10866 length:2946 start_codon:yes stop_codon:yes gene_type:complete
MTDTVTGAAETDYSATLFLPETSFPMRAGLPQREPEWLKRWEEMDIFALQREQAKDRPLFTIHDGPPYANGNIHIGHALNKTLKDLVSRSMQMLGFNSAYVPGWDCHGLPIEWKIEEQYRAKGKDKNDVPVVEFRQECRSFAEQWVDVQREEFKRLGILGEWDNPYLTMSFDAEAQIARELMTVASSGQLYRGSKPVMWSVVERTALAEAEIEYADYESDTIWVKFPVRSGGGDITSGAFHDLNASVIIWTTTPWTIPANRAISFSSRIAYGLYEVTKAPEGNWASTGEKYILADNLAADTFAKAKVEEFARIGDVDPAHITSCFHPLRGLGEGYNFEVPLLDGEHVTDDAGTGFVHTAPGHGLDDFEIWMNSTRLLGEKGIDSAIPYVVGDDGFYTKDAPGLEGARVIDDNGKKGDANNRVISALAERNAMVARGRVKHSYPHSWRSKKPVIFRNTPQWFVYMDRDIEGAAGDTLRHRALNAIDATKFYPASGQNRLRAMIADRPDWVLSRQRAWGVPISVFVRKGTNEVLKDEAVNHRIADAFEAEGADAWYKDGAAQRFLGDAYKADDFEMIRDVLDVWFDSGTTHAWVLRNKQKWPHLKFPASMYLEGSDQHRGWFHSSLLESCATNGFAPYESVLTHGFTMDGEGRKMSKSLGNTVAPQDIIKQYGADILRLWVASTDYQEDQRLGKEVIQTTVDSYRKLRNTLRWLLGNLAHYDAKDAVDAKDMPELEQVILHRLAQLDAQVRGAYKEYDYRKVVTLLTNFMNIELSAFYFDIRKDALYCDPISSIKRRAALTVLHHLFDCLTAWLAPILVFTMEEVWLERHPEEGSSVHLRLFPEVPGDWLNTDLAAKWQLIRSVRRVVTGALEIERREKRIGSSLEAAPQVFLADERYLTALKGQDLAEIAITSAIAVQTGEGPSEAFRLDDVAGIAVLPALAEGTRCARSWKVLPDVGSDPEYPEVSPRDAQALRERAAAGL